MEDVKKLIADGSSGDNPEIPGEDTDRRGGFYRQEDKRQIEQDTEAGIPALKGMVPLSISGLLAAITAVWGRDGMW